MYHARPVTNGRGKIDWASGRNCSQKRQKQAQDGLRGAGGQVGGFEQIGKGQAGREEARSGIPQRRLRRRGGQEAFITSGN